MPTGSRPPPASAAERMLAGTGSVTPLYWARRGGPPAAGRAETIEKPSTPQVDACSDRRPAGSRDRGLFLHAPWVCGKRWRQSCPDRSAAMRLRHRRGHRAAHPSVRASILWRPRPLPGRLRADSRRRCHYDLIWEEPVAVGSSLRSCAPSSSRWLMPACSVSNAPQLCH